MFRLPKLAWCGLAVNLVALVCSAIVFAQLHSLEHFAEDDPSVISIDYTEARLVERWAIAGIVLFILGTAMLAIASRRSKSETT